MPFVVSAQETITVERVLVDARVTAFDGAPIRGLEPKDFRVRIDGKDAVVESVVWVPETAVAREQVTSKLEASAAPPPAGRVMVFLVQTDFARDYGRKEAIAAALFRTMKMDEPPPPAPAAEPSLSTLLDRDHLLHTYHPETALKLLGETLRKVAENTGGFYGGASYITYNRLRATLSGHYELEVRPATTRRGEHSVSVKVRGRNVHVLARSAYADEDRS